MSHAIAATRCKPAEILASCRKPLRHEKAARRRLNHLKAGWGGRIRTSVWRNQNPLPYHLATPQHGNANTSPLPCRLPPLTRATAPCSNHEEPCPVSLSRDKRSRRPGSALRLSEADPGEQVTHRTTSSRGSRSRRGPADDPCPISLLPECLCCSIRCAVLPREQFKSRT